jgi:hypothetical protein
MIFDMTGLQTNISEKVEISFATENDLPYLVELLAELFSLESDFNADREKQLQGLRLILKSPDSGKLFILRVEGRLVGMANALNRRRRFGAAIGRCDCEQGITWQGLGEALG